MEHQPHTVQLIEDLLESLAELRKSTKATEATVRRGLRLAMNGADVATALGAVSPADTRQSMNDALKAVEEARHQMRLHIFEIGIQQGMSIGELGRIFGFSRQLAARYAKEAREAD
jgi:hypothetical protein